MKKRLFSMLLILSILLSAVPTALAVTDTEDNGSVSTAQPIALDETIEGMISQEYDFDFYSFTLEHSGTLSLDITSYMRYYSLYIYDTEGTKIWSREENEWNSTVGFRNDVRVAVLEAGTYYLKVTGTHSEYYYSRTSMGTYTIDVSYIDAHATETEPNNSILDATTVTFGDNLIGVIADNDSYDFYHFVLDESGQIILDITSYMKYYSWYLYDSSGTELAYSEDNTWNETVGFRNDLYGISLESGDYYLKVTGTHSEYYYSRMSTGTYTILTDFNPSNATEIESNNSIANANPIELNTAVTGLIGRNDRYDFYQIVLEESANLTMEITSYMQYYSLYLYNDTGDELWYDDQNEWNVNTGFRSDTIPVSLSAGTYYLKVTGYRYDTSYESFGTYTFTINREHTFGDWILVEASTETTEGTELRVCSVCGFEEVRVLPLLPHAHAYTSTVTAPTCAANGFTTYVCPCGDSYTANETPKTAHNYGKWITTLMPTVHAKGEHKRVCSACGHVEKAVLAKLTESFDDVSSDDWFVNEVAWAVAENITTGTSTTTFSPNTVCTRGQIVTFLWRAAGEPEPNSANNPFSDVSSGDYYYKAVLWAVEQGITNGMTATTFAPGADCTRGQVVTFLHRYAGIPEPQSSENPFSDVSGEYYYNAVLWAVEQGQMAGTGDGKELCDALQNAHQDGRQICQGQHPRKHNDTNIILA